jgi:peroxiredoxin
MSNPAYPAKVRRVNTTPAQSKPTSSIEPVIEDVEEYDEPYDVEVAPGGMATSPTRKAALGAAVVLLIAVFGTAIWLLSTPPPTNTGQLAVGLNVGNIAPNFEMIDVRTNKPVQLASLRGKPVLINFWGTWCPPCRQEMPAMQALYNKHKDEMVMLGVSMESRGDNPQVVKSFVDQAKYTWTFIHDSDFSVATQYQAYSIPSSYFIDKDGVIRARHIGAMDTTQMEGYLARTQTR